MKSSTETHLLHQSAFKYVKPQPFDCRIHYLTTKTSLEDSITKLPNYYIF